MEHGLAHFAAETTAAGWLTGERDLRLESADASAVHPRAAAGDVGLGERHAALLPARRNRTAV